MRLISRLAFSAGLVLCLAPCASLAAPLEGKVILTRVAPDALIVWDATDRIVTLQAAKKSPDDVLHTLEAESATAASSMLASYPKAKSVTVRIIYQRVGAVNPAYGNASLQGVERVVAIEYPVAHLAEKAPSYADAFAKGTTPGAVKVETLGKLPPVNT